MTSLENQYFMPTYDDSWLSQAFTQDNNTTFTTNTFYDDPFSPLSDMVRHDSTSSTFTSPCVSGSDLDTRHPPLQTRMEMDSVRNKKKITKRKSSAVKKSMTTFVNADASNFQQLVQQLTGVKFGEEAQVILKPEAQRVGNKRFHGCLPMLETSSVSFDHHQEFAACHSTAAKGGAGLNNECFPILESWVGM